MGIRGFIRNTVKAIRRFFSAPESESDLVDDASSIQYIDDTPAAEEIIVEKTVIEEVVTNEFVTEEVAVEETVLATIQPPSTDTEDIRLPVVEKIAIEEIAIEETVIEETVIEAPVSELATPTLDEEIDEPEDVDFLDDEVLVTQVSSPVVLDLVELTDVDSSAVPVDIADDLTDSHLSTDELDDIGSDDAILDDDLWHDNGEEDTVVELLPPSLERQHREPQRKSVAAVIELDILNYPVDITSELDDNFVEVHPILDTLPTVPRHQRIAKVVELDILNYSVDTADETEAYLNEIIYYNDDDQADEETENCPPKPINLFDDSDGIYVQSGGENVTLASALESLLFVAERPVDVAHLAKILGQSTKEVTLGLQTLDQFYTVTQRGLRIQDHEDKFQLVTAPFSASIVEDFLSFNLSTKLSGPALEALAVVAYRQPVTRAQVEAVRGVDCASVLRSLIQLGLIEESGRLETLGRPILYSITDLFMQHFGLLKMSELPPLEVKEEYLLMSTTELSEP